LAGDSLLVTEAEARTPSSIFDPQGKYARSLSLVEPPGLIHDCNEHGQLLIAIGLSPFRPRSGTWRDSTPFLVFDSRRGTADTIGRFPLTELFETSIAGYSGRSNVPFGRSLVRALGPTEAYIGIQDGYEIQAIGLRGQPPRTITRSWTPVPVTDAWIRRYEDAIAANRARVAAVRGTVDPPNTAPVPYPKAMPPYAAFRVSSTGSLWVRDYHPSDAIGSIAGADSTVAWTIFDRDGRVRGRLHLPLSLAILDLGADYLLGRWRDADGVETIRLYRLSLP
jgi:hypothetical protein